LREFFREAGGVGAEAVLREAIDRQPVCGGPAEGEVPLGAGVVVAHGEAAAVLEEREMTLERGCLLWGGEFCPEGIERRDVVVG
jgi:hypothetical protein